MGGATLRGGRLSKTAWTLVFGVNLIVPVVLGMEATGTMGRVGMIVGTITLWGLGFAAGRKSSRIGYALLAGGIVVALMQIVPIVQGFTGAFVLRYVRSIGLMGLRPGLEHASSIPYIPGAIGGFVATILTGGLLMVLAVVLGLGVRAVVLAGVADPEAPAG